MAATIKTVIQISTAVVAFAALESCSKQDGTGGKGDANSKTGAQTALARQLFPDDFKGVCSGASVSNATPYDPSSKAHKALYFATYKDDLTDRSFSLPDDWTVQYSSNGDAFKAIDLVVCAKRTADRQVKVCEGYENKGKATQNKVRWHTATYALSVWEATTGKKLMETSVEATDSNCPMFTTFDGSSDTVDAYASLPDSAVTDFLKPHMAH